jgi:predicted transcriptional regulator
MSTVKKQARKTVKTLSIDKETSDKLDTLRELLQSPRSWIIHRLVAFELRRVESQKRFKG